jgi:DNA-binding response OmpR family regulator
MATRIMVVDDEPAIGKLLMYQLAGFGYQVYYFHDGLEALQRLPATRPDLVLLDVMMPLISGWEVCGQIRVCSTVPIIMLTAKGADSDIVAGLGAGADDYVTKPFSMAQLHARIEAVLRRAAPRSGVRALTAPSWRSGPPLAVLAAAPAAEVAEETRLAPAAPAPPAEPTADAPPFRLGPHIRETRAAQGLTLHQIERAIKVRWEFLQAIEQENWSYLPRAELRRALKIYPEYLGIDLPALIGRSRARAVPEGGWGRQPFVPLQFAAALAVVMVLVVVGMYLL